MHDLNANLVAVQWGLLGVFGVVVGLLIAPTDRYLQEFLASGAGDDRRRAARWAASVRITSVLVLLSLAGLSFLGARDADLNLTAGLSTVSWLLLTPLLAQAGFVALVLCLVRYVPPVLTLPLQQPPTYHASPGGHRGSTIIRFVNETSREMYAYWLNFEGKKDRRGSASVAAGSEMTVRTYEGHRFLVTTPDGKDVCTVAAAATPGKAVIEPMHLSAIS